MGKEKSRYSVENPFRLEWSLTTARTCLWLFSRRGRNRILRVSSSCTKSFLFLDVCCLWPVVHSFLWKINPLAMFIFLVCVWVYLAQSKFKPNQECWCVMNLGSLYLENKEHGSSIRLALPAFHQWCMQKSITEECVTSFDMDPCPEA